MKKKLTNLAIAATIVLSGLHAPASAALTVTPDANSNDLITSILGPGITIVGTPTVISGANSIGFFNNGVSAGLGINQGIVLSSGDIYNAIGPNDLTDKTTDLGIDGDTQLDALIPGYTTYDATSLEFKFISQGGNLYFNYVFGSEEYNEWVDSDFNDVFGFFLDGQNIALILGSDTPVSINNVNNGLNSAYFKDNTLTPSPYDTQYDGLTTVLTAKALGLTAGEHTIKLAIADAGDHILDSGVFIQGGSFSHQEFDPEDLNDDHGVDPTPSPEPGSMILGMLGLSGMLGLKKKKSFA